MCFSKETFTPRPIRFFIFTFNVVHYLFLKQVKLQNTFHREEEIFWCSVKPGRYDIYNIDHNFLPDNGRSRFD